MSVASVAEVGASKPDTHRRRAAREHVASKRGLGLCRGTSMHIVAEGALAVRTGCRARPTNACAIRLECAAGRKRNERQKRVVANQPASSHSCFSVLRRCKALRIRQERRGGSSSIKTRAEKSRRRQVSMSAPQQRPSPWCDRARAREHAKSDD